jgi:hypothetical protein
MRAGVGLGCEIDQDRYQMTLRNPIYVLLHLYFYRKLYKIYRCVTMVYYYLNSGRYPSSYLLFKTTFRRLDSISVFRWYLLSWSQSRELIPVSGDDWADLRRYYLKTETESSLLRRCVLNKSQDDG